MPVALSADSFEIRIGLLPHAWILDCVYCVDLISLEARSLITQQKASSGMNSFEMNRRQALIASGLGTMSLGMPGAVMGADKVDESGKAVASDKSCIFVLLCGGPSHVDTWDMKPEAPLDYRGPYEPIATKVPGMRINEMHTGLAKLTDHFHAH